MPDHSPPVPPRPQRPEPIAWTLVESLAARAQTVAKGWLLALLERAPLDAVGALPAGALAAEGPAICAAVARALGSDAELERLMGNGDLAPLAQRIAPLAAATDEAATVLAVDSLRACLWAALLEAVGERADAEAVAALAERLATVAAVVTAAALAGVAAPAVAATLPVAHDVPERPVAVTGDLVVRPPPPAEPAPAAERHDARNGHAPAEVPSQLPGSVTELPARPAPDPREGPAAAMDDSDLWIATLERHIDRCRREGGGLALLRVELVDGERLTASAPPEERGVPYGRLAQAIRRAIRRQDLVASDRRGRAWVIAPAVGRAGAIALAERIGAGVEHGEHWRGAPLAATIGFAVYGEDGQEAATLIDRAEEAMLAASAAGVRIGESVPFDGDDAGRPGPRLVR